MEPSACGIFLMILPCISKISRWSGVVLEIFNDLPETFREKFIGVELEAMAVEAEEELENPASEELELSAEELEIPAATTFNVNSRVSPLTRKDSL